MSISLLLRCDAGSYHGLGHLWRCLTLADALRSKGAESEFLIGASGAILRMVEARGHRAAAKAPAGSREDLAEVLAALDALSYAGVILDGKSISPDYVAACSGRTVAACLDDELCRDYPCRLLVNNNVWASEAFYPARAGRRLLLGPRYNLVVPAFFSCSGLDRRGVLITMGGRGSWQSYPVGPGDVERPVGRNSRSGRGRSGPPQSRDDSSRSGTARLRSRGFPVRSGTVRGPMSCRRFRWGNDLL